MNSEMIWKIQKKSKLSSEKIWKLWKKSKLNGEKIWKIWKKSKLKCYMKNTGEREVEKSIDLKNIEYK